MDSHSDKVKPEMLSRQELIQIYLIIVEEEHFYSNSRQKRAEFYSGLFIAMLTGIGALFVALYSRVPLSYLLLILAPLFLLTFSIVQNSLSGLDSLYQRFLEAIVYRMKIEELLGFGIKLDSYYANERSYKWMQEPMRMTRYSNSWKDVNSSEEFVSKNLHKGSHRRLRFVFKAITWFSLVAAVASLVLAFSFNVWSLG